MLEANGAPSLAYRLAKTFAGKNDRTDSWTCIDCGFNTAPGIPGKERVERALAAYGSITAKIDENSEASPIESADTPEKRARRLLVLCGYVRPRDARQAESTRRFRLSHSEG
jgi:hypothetical protein